MKPWEIREAELEKMEKAYLERYTPFQKWVDNHWTYMLSLILMVPFCIGIGIGIGIFIGTRL